MQDYPNYKYRPRRRKHGKRSCRGGRTSVSNNGLGMVDAQQGLIMYNTSAGGTSSASGTHTNDHPDNSSISSHSLEYCGVQTPESSPHGSPFSNSTGESMMRNNRILDSFHCTNNNNTNTLAMNQQQPSSMIYTTDNCNLPLAKDASNGAELQNDFGNMPLPSALVDPARSLPTPEMSPVENNEKDPQNHHIQHYIHHHHHHQQQQQQAQQQQMGRYQNNIDEGHQGQLNYADTNYRMGQTRTGVNENPVSQLISRFGVEQSQFLRNVHPPYRFRMQLQHEQHELSGYHNNMMHESSIDQRMFHLNHDDQNRNMTQQWQSSHHQTLPYSNYTEDQRNCIYQYNKTELKPTENMFIDESMQNNSQQDNYNSYLINDPTNQINPSDLASEPIQLEQLLVNNNRGSQQHQLFHLSQSSQNFNYDESKKHILNENHCNHLIPPPQQQQQQPHHHRQCDNSSELAETREIIN